MITFICLFFPAIFSVALFELFTRKQLSKRHILYLFVFDTMIINFVCFFVKTFVLGTGNGPLYDNSDMFPSTALKYLIMAVPVAIIISGMISCLSTTVNITVEEQNDEEKG